MKKTTTRVLSLLLAVVMICSMAACQKKTTTAPKPTKPVPIDTTEAPTEPSTDPVETEPVETDPVETEPVENPTDPDADETPDIDAMFTCETVDGNLVITAVKDNRMWSITMYDELVTLEQTEDDENMVFTLTPNEAGDTNFDIIGDTAEDAVFLYFHATIADDLTVDVTYDSEYLKYTFEPVDMGEIDEDLDAVANKMLDKLGDLAPVDKMKNMVDVADADMIQSLLGVESVEGLVKMGTVDPMMNIDTFAMSVLMFDTAENAAASVDTLTKSAPLNKWVCVSADGAHAEVVDDVYVVVIMARQEQLDLLKAE